MARWNPYANLEWCWISGKLPYFTSIKRERKSFSIPSFLCDRHSRGLITCTVQVRVVLRAGVAQWLTGEGEEGRSIPGKLFYLAFKITRVKYLIYSVHQSRYKMLLCERLSLISCSIHLLENKTLSNLLNKLLFNVFIFLRIPNAINVTLPKPYYVIMWILRRYSLLYSYYQL